MTAPVRPIEGIAALLAQPFTTPNGARWRWEAALAAGDPWTQASKLACAAYHEWGRGDERTSEAIRLYILECDRAPYGRRRLACQVRRALIVAHRLDDMCPVHLVDLVPNRGEIGPAELCPICDEDE